MEPLSRDDPRRLGPYHVIARLGPSAGEVPATARHFIARSAAGDRTVVVTAPPEELAHDVGYRERFRAEAENARLLGGGRPPLWLAPVVEISDGGVGTPWSATPFLPMLSLSAALEANGGPLPVRTVRALGAALAETLAEVHTAGFAHAGIAPGTVYLAGDGPRLVSYGAVRAAASDGEARVGLPGLEDDALPPEQAAGGRPRPLGDIFALGAVLAYAATGRRRPDADELPKDVRSAVARCLAQDPADRPTARALLDELTRGLRVPLPSNAVRAPAGAPPTVVDGGSEGPYGGTARGAGPGSTALDSAGGISRAAGALGAGWLPGRVIAALSELSSVVLAAEIEPAEVSSSAETPLPVAAGVPPAGPATASHQAGAEGLGAAPVAPDRGPVPGAGSAGTAGGSSRKPLVPSLSPSRRRLLLGVAGGTAGLAVGGGATWLATAPEPPAPLTPAQRLAAHRPRHRLPGAPPTPLWRYDVTGAASTYAPLVWREAVAVITGERAVTGIDLRTGKRLWTREELRPAGQPWVAGGDALVVPGDGLVSLEPRTGRIHWRSNDFRQDARSSFTGLLAVDGTTVWFTATVRGEGSGGANGDRVVVAYDVHEGAELWRGPLAAGFDEGHLLKEALVVMAGADRGRTGPRRAIALSRDRGEELWQRVYPGMTAEGLVTTDGRRTLIAALGTTLRGFDATRDSAALWSVGAKGKDAKGRLADFGVPLVHGKTAYAADGGFALHAVEAATGEIRWQRAYGFVMKVLAAPRTPDTLVSPAGRRVLMAGDAEVDAFDAEDGSLLWRFTDAGADPGPRSRSPRRKVALTDDRVVVVGSGSVYALPLD
ncbi:outer membrane protein assembly factor BamB family protein [Streptomyces sp. S465]|uniref:outer membrane protein assembly factor BamB family protein n=1 Tax=Streptomyces sp. S465 TaxID=2979468 RepID=UPI0022A88271|nr:PQQ-binding-like beta-propeller repeat protein [Streptomyces sp. S465]WAP58661.1 PQQ-binding-like beta-propeller repeat protein [Streptomyces sp. S465]